MAELDRYLAEDEELEFVTYRHISTLVRPVGWILVAVVFAVLFGLLARQGRAEEALDLVAGTIVALAGINLLLAVFRWRAEEVALTDRRLVEVSGLWRKRVTSIPYPRIVSVALERGFWARLARSGDVVVEMGQRGRVRVARLPRAKAFYRHLVALASGDPSPRSRREDREDTDPGPLPRSPL